MVRSSRAEMAAFREAVFTRDGWKCVWPGCIDPTYDLQLVHLHHRGMGGSRERNTMDNAVVMCSMHHSMFDDRIGTPRREKIAGVQRWAGIG